MTKKIFIIYILLVFGCFLLFSQCKNTNAIEKYSIEMNKKCPYKINLHTNLISTEVSGQNIILNYVTNHHTELYDSTYLALLDNNNLHNIASNNDIKPLRDANATIIHRYRNDSNALILELKYTPNDYLNFRKDKKDEIYPYLQQIVNQTGEKLPIYLTDNICIIEMKAKYPMTLEYTMQINNEVTENTFFIEKKTLANNLKKDGSATKLRESEVTFQYKIVDKNKKLINEFEVTPEDYK